MADQSSGRMEQPDISGLSIVMGLAFVLVITVPFAYVAHVEIELGETLLLLGPGPFIGIAYIMLVLWGIWAIRVAKWRVEVDE